MTTYLIIIGGILLLECIILILAKSFKNGFGKTSKQKSQAYSYHTRPFLTSRESSFYKSLAPIAEKHRLSICAKVRLADILEPQKGQDWRSAMNKIEKKHVDFLLCKPGLVPVLALELDDSTHDRQERKDRDAFVDGAFKSAKFPILHTRDISGLEEKILKAIGIR